MSQVVDLTASLAGRYTIERELGRGAMGTVYLAWEVKNRRKVAIKVLKPELTADIDRARFLREIQIVASMRHPHILPLHDSDEVNGSLYYVMPFVEGETLEKRLEREGQLPVPEAIRFALEVADALAYAHKQGVVHRDIKPANIMLESNHAVVTDFGVALLLETVTGDRLTETGQSPGTPLYMSPEQFFADRSLDRRTDVYSLGCVLFEMLCGDPPFTGSTYQAIQVKKLFEPVPSLCILRQTITESLERLTHRALARHPADRFQSADELVQALEVAAREQPSYVSLNTAAERGGEGAAVLAERARQRRSKEGFGEGVSDPVAKLLVAAGLSLGVLTLVGLLTVAIYDIKMQIPVEFSPTRFDFPIIGLRALVPGAVSVILVLAVYLLLKYTGRLLARGFRHAAEVTPSLGTWRARSLQGWQRFTSSINPGAVPEIAFAASVVATLIVLALFGDILGALTDADPELLSCTNQAAHFHWTWAMSALITALAIVYRKVLRFIRERGASSQSIKLVKRAGFSWLVILLLLMTAPWFVLWHSERPRVQLNGQRAYILVERDQHLVIYKPEERVTEHYRNGEPPGLVRLNTTGNVFEPEGGCK